MIFSPITILAHNHGNEFRLSYGPVDENGKYTCWAENAAGLAVYKVVMKDELTIKINEVTEEMQENVSTYPTQGKESSVQKKDGLRGLLTVIYALFGSLVVSFAALTVIRYKYNI